MIHSDFLFRLPNPQVFTGKEINSIHKDPQPGDVQICLAFPDVYEIGMSHSGLKILYHFLNDMPGVVAERAFLPEREGAMVFRSSGVPLFSLERRLPLHRFDMLGISLMSELSFTNLLLLLELGQIPQRSSDRGPGHPLIIAGGIAVANPEPLRDFIDLFAVGDGEMLFPDIISVWRRQKERGCSRQETLQALDRLPGVYVPLCHPPEKNGRFFQPQMQGKIIKKQVFKGFSRFAFQEKEIIPITNVVFNRLNVELARGCPQQCHFCQAKAYYAPYRVRDMKRVLSFIKNALPQTGYEAFSLSALSAGDYPHLGDLLESIPGMIGPEISFSVPSLRPAVLSGHLLDTIGQFRRTGITIVPEAGSRRLRQIINKRVSDEDIYRALDLAIAHGWQRIKMYFMIGLPGESMEDVAAIVSLIKGLSHFCFVRGRKLGFHVSFSPFVPKPHTPLSMDENGDGGEP